MKKTLAVILVALGLMGCQQDRATLVWGEPTRPSVDVATPESFVVSPSEAYEIVRNKPWALSQKHVWHIYADERNYYVIDSFLGSSPRKALRTGVVVDGQTGEIRRRSSDKTSESDGG